MPNKVSINELNNLLQKIQEGDVSSAYQYLQDRGYSYAGWANGIASENAVIGRLALGCLRQRGEDDGYVIDNELVQEIKHNMVANYINYLLDKAK